MLVGYSVLALAASISGVPLWCAVVAAAVAAFAFRSPQQRPLDAWLLWLFGVPVLVLVTTTPGADAAMYVAMARALLDGSPDLSAGWPDVQAAVYPRGYPALIALLTPLLGIAKASLASAIIGYITFVTAVSALLRRYVHAHFAFVFAVFLTLLSRHVPLGFFHWGGSSTIFGFALALHALQRPHGALLLAGAFATHPIGAIGGLACAPLLGNYKRTALLVVSIAPVLYAFKHFGPVISPFEADWITNWQRTSAALIKPSLGIFPLDYLSTVSSRCGDTFMVVFYVCLGITLLLWRSRERVLLAVLALVGLIYIALLMAIGPKLPVVGTFVYADRLTPMWIVAMAPFLAVFTRDVLERRRIPLVVFAALLVITRWGWHVAPQLLRADDIAIMPCISEKVPRGETVVASYGQGGQWLPAITGHAISQAHAHCSLFDEISASRARMQSRYQYLSTAEKEYGEIIPALPAAETLCEHGGVKLVRLIDAAASGPDPW